MIKTETRKTQVTTQRAQPAQLTNSTTISQEDLQELANIFKAMGEFSRLLLLKALMQYEELSVGSLALETELSQANVSKHLRTLHQAGLVATRREGTTIHYRIADEMVYELCTLCCERLDEKKAALLKKLKGRGVEK